MPIHILTLASFLAQPAAALPANGAIAAPHGEEQVPIWLILPPGYTGDIPRPLILFFHGRGYGTTAANTNMLKDEFSTFRRKAGDLGYIMAGVATGPNTWMNEIARKRTDAALAYLQANLNVNPDRVYTMGVSMGGGAALTFAKHRPAQVAAVVDFMGATDFARFYHAGFYNESLAGAFGGTVYDARATYDAQSAVVDPEMLKTVPVLIVHGDQDTVIPAWNATLLWEAVQPLNNGSELVLRAGMGHTNEIVMGIEDRILNFLEKHPGLP